MKKFLLALAVIILVTATATIAMAASDVPFEPGIGNATTTSVAAGEPSIDLVNGTVDLGDYNKAFAIAKPGKKPSWKPWTADAWKKAEAKLFKSGGELYLSKTAIVPANKAPATATSVKFANIEKQGKLKLAVNYLAFADDTGLTDGKWAVFTKDDMKDAAKVDKSTSAQEDLQYLYEENVAKINDIKTAKWTAFDATGSHYDNGFPLSNWKKGTGESAKPTKAVWFIRAPGEVGTGDNIGKYYPPSAVVKLSVAPLGKEPALKANFKTETIKIKADMRVSTGTSFVSWSKDELKADKKLALVDVSANITSGNAVKVFNKATAKKPASAIQTVPLAPRGVSVAPTTSTDKKKIVLGENMQARIGVGADETENKWGGAPKLSVITSDVTIIEVRFKPNAKWNKNDKSWGDTKAAGTPLKFTVSVNADGEITAINPA